ncbi:phosphoribosylformylglycinamidine synthase subunit PurS [Amaricoccus tamworthensis]|uniref:phosphoribosylformylglycinamidine synthase subunit PurS n=1 Tax=Amaricoccus tamworthensis TaxID=57002 RepID=UPI003C7C235C
MQAKVLITLKNGVLDPQGEAVLHALDNLGFDDVDGVRVGKMIELDLSDTNADTARTRVEKMCEKLLANTVIEDYEVEIL